MKYGLAVGVLIHHKDVHTGTQFIMLYLWDLSNLVPDDSIEINSLGYGLIQIDSQCTTYNVNDSILQCIMMRCIIRERERN